MGLDLLVTDQVLAIRLYPAFTVGEHNIFAILTDRNGPNANLILTKDIDFFLFGANIPNPKVSSLIARKYFLLVRMYKSTVDRFILFHFLLKILAPQIKNLQISILTTGINNFIMWSKTNRCNIAFEMCWIKCFLWSLITALTVQIKDFYVVVHSDD